MQKGVVNSFDGEFAVIQLEGNNLRNIKKLALPQGIKEGTVIVVKDGEWKIDHQKKDKILKDFQTNSGYCAYR